MKIFSILTLNLLIFSPLAQTKVWFDDTGTLVFRNGNQQIEEVSKQRFDQMVRVGEFQEELKSLLSNDDLWCFSAYDGFGSLTKDVLNLCVLLNSFESYQNLSIEEKLKADCLDKMVQPPSGPSLSDLIIKPDPFDGLCGSKGLIAKSLKEKSHYYWGHSEPIFAQKTYPDESFSESLQREHFANALALVKEKPTLLKENICQLSVFQGQKDSAQMRRFIKESFRIEKVINEFKPLSEQNNCFHDLVNSLIVDEKEKEQLNKFFPVRFYHRGSNPQEQTEVLAREGLRDICNGRDVSELSVGMSILGSLFKDENSYYPGNFSNTFDYLLRFQDEVFNPENVSKYLACKDIKSDLGNKTKAEKEAIAKFCVAMPESYLRDLRGYILGYESILEVLSLHEQKTEKKIESLETFYEKYGIPDSEGEYLESLVNLTDELPNSLKSHPAILEINRQILLSSASSAKDLALKRSEILRQIVEGVLKNSQTARAELEKVGISLKVSNQKGILSDIGKILKKIYNETRRFIDRAREEARRFVRDVKDEVARLNDRLASETKRLNDDFKQHWEDIKKYGDDSYNFVKDLLIDGVELVFCPKERTGGGWCVEGGVKCHKEDGETKCVATNRDGNSSEVGETESERIGAEQLNWLKETELQDFYDSFEGVLDEGLFRLFESNYKEVIELTRDVNGNLSLPTDPVVREQFISQMESLRSFESILINARDGNGEIKLSEWQKALFLVEHEEEIVAMYNLVADDLAIDAMGIGWASPLAPLTSLWEEYTTTDNEAVKARIIAEIATEIGLALAPVGAVGEAFKKAIKKSRLTGKIDEILEIISNVNIDILPDKFIEYAQKIGANTKEGIENVANFINRYAGDEIGSVGDLGDLKRLERKARRFNLNFNSSTTQTIVNSLNMKASDFISKYRKASVLSEFPGELLDSTIEEILLSNNSTAKKLIKDKRFLK